MAGNANGITGAVQSAIAPKAGELRAHRSRLMDDMRSVVQDAERLLRTASDASRDGFGAARNQLEQTLSTTRMRLMDAEDEARARFNRAAYAAGDFVQDHPVRALLIAAGVGALLTWVLTRGGGREDDYFYDDERSES